MTVINKFNTCQTYMRWTNYSLPYRIVRPKCLEESVTCQVFKNLNIHVSLVCAFSSLGSYFANILTCNSMHMHGYT